MTKRKSTLVLVTVSALILLLLSQCTGSPVKPGFKAERTVTAGKTGKTNDRDAGLAAKSLRVAVSLDAQSFGALQKLSNSYGETHGGMTVQLDNLPAKEAYASLKKSSQLGEAADLLLLDNNWVSEFAALGYLQPVDELYTTEMQAQRLPVVQNQVKWNGYLWAVPHQVDPYIFAWNPKFAEAYKQEHPPETAEELLQWSQTLSKPEEGRYGIYFEPADSVQFVAMASSLTGVWYDPAQAANAWTDTASIKKLESFLLPGEGTPGANRTIAKLFPMTTTAWNPWDQLQKGKIGAIVTTFSAFRQRTADGLEVASLPHTFTDKEGKYVWLQGKSFAVSSRSTNRAAAMDWIKEMTSAEAASRMWAEAKMLPALVPALNAAISSDPYAKKYEWLLNNAVVLPANPETNKKLNSMQAELQRLYDGKQDVNAFAETMSKLWAAASK